MVGPTGCIRHTEEGMQASMSRPLKFLWHGLRFCVSCAFSFAVWSAWLVLALLLAGQIYIATHSELEVPGFLLRALEERLAVSGVRVTFGRTSFDPTGRVLIEDAHVSLRAFSDPVMAARAIYTRLDPWALLAGKFDPSELRVMGASLAIPAMLSRSGATEPILADLDATFLRGENTLDVAQFSARIANVAVSAHGAIYLSSGGSAPSAPLPVAEFLARNFALLCRELEAASLQLAAVDQAHLHLELAPSESRTAIASVTLFARGWTLNLPAELAGTRATALQISGLKIITKLPFLGEAPVAARLEFSADDLTLPFDAKIHGVHALVRGILRPTQAGFTPRDVEVSAESLTATDFAATSLAARITPAAPMRSATDLVVQKLDLVGRFLGLPLAVRALADLKAETATVRFEGAVSSKVMDSISARVHTNARRFFDFKELDCTDGVVTLGPGWKFEKISARTNFQGIDAYHVHMEEGRAVVEFDGRHLHSPDAWARIGENIAHGTYDHDLTTKDYRFLLTGQLRPLDIGGWFGAWWPNFFHDFALPVGPPKASVDVQGRWTDGSRSNIFVFVETEGPIIRGTKLDFARSRLFIRPGYYDGLELLASRGPGGVRGTFRLVNDPARAAWFRFDFNLASTLDPALAVSMIGPKGAEILAPFAFGQPPALKLSGRLDGPAAPGGAHQTVDIEARSAGEFRLHDFPLENIAFTAAVRDDNIAVDNLRAGFAGGVATGSVKLSGRGAHRRVSANLTLRDASLGGAAAVLQDFAARRNGTPPSPPGKFIQEKAGVRLDLTASAEGLYAEPFSYQGEGTASLQGVGLGEVPLLGLLSELLRFTALRFTSATAKFKLDGAKLTFSAFELRGANSAIEAHGDYALDRRELDFKAKILPFGESGNLLKSALGTVLSPLSNVFEVVLTGTLDQPKWAFALGPTTLMRALTPNESTALPKPENPAPPPTAKP